MRPLQSQAQRIAIAAPRHSRIQYPARSLLGSFLAKNKPRVTAGLTWHPEMGPTAYTIASNDRPQARAIPTLPIFGPASTALPTPPSAKTNVPTPSAIYFFHALRPVARVAIVRVARVSSMRVRVLRKPPAAAAIAPKISRKKAEIAAWRHRPLSRPQLLSLFAAPRRVPLGLASARPAAAGHSRRRCRRLAFYSHAAARRRR